MPVSRRALFVLAGAGVLTAAGCGQVQVGRPERYTPPPAGIDDLYRGDLLVLLQRLIASVERLRADGGTAPSDGGGDSATTAPSDGGGTGDDIAPTGDPGTVDVLAVLSMALPVQREALLTGGQAEREREREDDPDPKLQVTPVPVETASDVAGVVDLLVELRDLCAQAARQVSGSLARPVIAVGAYSMWAAGRLSSASGQGTVTASPEAESIVPTREVPEHDPPSIGAEVDYHALLETAQRDEWYAGYVHEVLAAGTQDEAREAHLATVGTHRTRAEELALIAEQDGAPVVARQAVYPLPGGILTPASRVQLPIEVDESLLVAHIALVGAAPFERRALPIAAALQQAAQLAVPTSRMPPLPSLEPEA